MTVPASASPGDVFARERQEHIARIVEEHGRARVSDLAAQFGVSAVTIRKDLVALESEHRLVRTHGGAIAIDRSRPELAFEIRERLQADEKLRIGAAGRGPRPRRREHRHGRQHDGPVGRSPPQGARRLEPGDRHHERPAARLGARRPSRDHRPDARRARPLGGAVGRRPARRRPVQPDQRPEGVPRRGRLHARVRPGRRDRRRGPDQALDGRRRPRGHRDRRPHEMGARRLRHVLPDRQDQHRPDRRGRTGRDGPGADRSRRRGPARRARPGAGRRAARRRRSARRGPSR